jgi:hypothetical protein
MTPFRRLRRGTWRTLHRHRWALLGGLALLWLALGLWGYTDYYPRLGFFDRLYIALALFRDTTTIYHPQTGPPFPWPLEVSRFLAPVTLVLAGLSAVAAVFAEQFNWLRIRWLYRGHLVVCGLGQFGLRLAIAFDDRGSRVVVVDWVPDSIALSRCRERFIPVLSADATDPQVLRRAGVTRARHLIAVCGDSSINAEIGMVAKRHFGNRRKWLECFVHVDDDELCQMLEQSKVTRQGQLDQEHQQEVRVSINYVNVLRSGPLAILRAFPDSFREHDGRSPHIIVVGTDPIGLAFISGAARNWWFDHRDRDKYLQLTLIASDAEQRAQSLRSQYSHFDEACRLVPYTFDFAGPDPSPIASLEHDADWGLTTVFVTYAEERDALAATMRLVRDLPNHVPIVVVTTGQGGTSVILDTMASDLNLSNVSTFPLLDRVCRPEIFVSNLTTRIAEALHEQFLEDRRRDRTFDATRSPHQPWDKLDETFRESSFDQAIRYGDRLSEAGYSVELTDEWDKAIPTFTDDETEAMARVEHERWCEERWAAGWVYSQIRDDARKHHPDLKPWEALDESDKNKDREIVRELPQVLIRHGLAIIRAGQRS